MTTYEQTSRTTAPRLWSPTRARWGPVVAMTIVGLALIACAFVGCALPPDANDTGQDASPEVMSPDGGVVHLYKPDLSTCPPTTRLDTLDNCVRCGRSCRGMETPGFPAICCPPREGWGGGCAILNTDNDCSDCGDQCHSGSHCIERRCVP